MDEKDILKVFGNRLKEKRKAAKLTQAKLAEKVGLSTNFIGMVERGERNTNYTNVFKVIYSLDTTLEEFFKGL